MAVDLRVPGGGYAGDQVTAADAPAVVPGGGGGAAPAVEPPPTPAPAQAPPMPATGEPNPYVAVGETMAGEDRAAQAEPNPYVSIGEAYGNARRSALQSSLAAAVETDADRHARVLALSSKLQLPADVVDRNLDLVANRAKLSGIDAGRLLTDHPELSDWLSKPDNAAIAQDDLPVLQTIDHAMRSLTDPGADPTGILPAGFMFNRAGEIVEHSGQGFSTHVGSMDDLRRLLDARDDRASVEQIDRLTRMDQLQRMYEADGAVTQVGAGVLGSATGSLVLNALRLGGWQGQNEDDALQALHAAAAAQTPKRLGGYLDPGALLRGGVGLIADTPLLLAGGQLGRLVGGTSRLAKAARVATTFAPVNAANLVENTRDHGLAFGATSFLINSLVPAAFGEVGAARVLLGSDAATAAAGGWGSAATRFLKDVGIQASQMQAIEAANALHEFASGVDPNALRMDRLVPRLITAGLLGGSQAGFLHLPVAIGEKFHRDVVAAGAADSFAQRLTTAVDVVRSSKLQERSPEAMAVLLQALGGPERKTYLQTADWDAHWKKAGQDPLEAAKAVGAEQAYREAKATGGDMAVPVEAFVQGAAAVDGADSLIAKARQEPGAMSAEEAAAFQKEMPKTVERLRAEVQAAAELAHDEPTQHVHDDLVRQLVEAGTEPATAKRQATILAAGFRTLADRMNAGAAEGAPRLTAQDLYDRYQVRVQRADNGATADGATTFDQRVPAAADQNLKDPEALRARAEAEARGELAQVADPNAATGRYPAIQAGEVLGQPGADAEITSYNQAVPAGPRLSALHNVSAEKLLSADKLGGLAVPSIAVIPEGQDAHSGFGEITLIGGRSLADPADVPVFDSDAYTARFPDRVYRKARTAPAQKLIDELRKSAGAFDEHHLSLVWDYLVNNGDPERAANELLRSNVGKAAFLVSIGKKPEPVMRDKRLDMDLSRDPKVVEAYQSIDWKRYNGDGETPEDKAYVDQVDKMLGDVLLDSVTRVDLGTLKGRDRKTLIEVRQADLRKHRLGDDGGLLPWARGRLGDDIKAIGKREVDPGETRDALDSALKGHEAAFQAWVEAKVLPLGGEPMIALGRKKVPFTLDNVVEAMTSSANARGKEKGMTFGEGQARAAASHQFTDLEEMRSASSAIKSESEVSDAREKAKKLLEQYRAAVLDHFEGIDWSGKRDTWRGLDASMQAIARWAKGAKTEANLAKALAREGFKSVPAKALELGVEAGKAFLVSPVPYFEAKPHRAVALSEFRGAVIPTRAEPEVRALLQKHGIETAEYADDADRAKAVSDLRAKLHEGGEDVLFQTGGDQRRGSITFGPEGRATISLFEQKNLSTFLHEGGHLFLEVFGDLAEHEHAPPQIREDFAKILDWLGVKDRGSIGVDQHEKFARGFETYLMEGKAPSLELRSAFARVKQWMKDLYGKLSALGADLSDEVRGVFDRLLATDDEIAAAERSAGATPLFATAAEAGMTDRQFAAYRATAEKAHEVAVADLERQLIAEERKAQTEAYKQRRTEVRTAVETEVDAQPVFVALHALQDGKLPGGEPMAEAVKLDRADLVARYGEAALKALPGPGKGKANRGRHVYGVDGGITLDQAAELFGFPTGDDLYRALAEAPNREKEIERQTSERMREIYPDSRTDGSFVEKAQDAVANEHRADVLVAEIKALRKLQREAKPVATEAAKTATEAERQRGDNRVAAAMSDAAAELAYERALGKAKLGAAKDEQRAAEAADVADRKAAVAAIPPVELLRATAREAIAGRRAGDLNPNGYLVAARKASREAFSAAARGDYARAADAKQQELMAHELYRAASDAKAAVEAGVKHLRGLQTPKARERIGKAGGWEWTVTKPDGSTEVYGNEAEAEKAATNTPGSAFARTSGYLEQLDALLDRFDLRNVGDAALRRRETLAQWVALRQEADEQVAIPEHLLDESVRKNWKQLTVDELSAVVDAAKNIETMARLKNKLLREKEQRTLEERAGQVAATIEEHSRGERTPKIGRSILDRASDWFGMMLASLRKMTSLVREMDGFKDGGAIHDLTIRQLNEASDLEATDRHAAAVAFHDLAKEWGKLGPTATLRRRIPGLDRPISLEARIAVALNWGNAGNRDRLMKANFSADEVHAILDTLDEKDWRFVQGIWDHVNSYWPRIAAKQQRVTGVAPEKVDAIPVETRYGTFKGGYYPIAKDSRLSSKAHGMLVAEQANLMKAGGYTAATTRRGHTKARSEVGDGSPLRMDLGVIPEHLARVIHDLAFHETLIDVNRLMRQKGVEAAVRKHYGDRAYDLISATLQDTAAGQVFAQDGFEKAVNWLTAGSGAATMGWNLQVALMNASGITQSLARIGPAYLLKGLGHVMRDAAGWQNSGTWIDSVSPYMRERSRINLRDAEDVTRRMNATGALDPLRATFHYFTVKMDRAVGIPTWLGAYEKAMAEHGDEPKAIAAADATVRETQGSNAVHDLAAVQRGHPMKRLFTQFYHYMSTTYNLTAESVNRFKGRAEAPTSLPAIGHDVVAGVRLMSDMLCLYLLPAAMAAAVRVYLHPHRDKREGFAEEYPREVAGMFMGTIPLVRDFASVLTAGTTYKGPTGTRGLEQVGDLVAKLRAEYQKPQKDHHLDRAFLQSLGILLRLPTVQAQRTIDGFLYLHEHGGSLAPLIGGPPPKH